MSDAGDPAPTGPAAVDPARAGEDRSELRPSAEIGAEIGGAIEPAPIEPLKVVLSLGVAVVAMTLTVAAIGYFFRGPLLALAALFVGTFGGLGVAIGFFLPDAFTVPIPNDAFSALGLAGGLGFVTVSAWATLGSLVGGSTGFFIGRRLARAPWYRRVMSRRGAQVQGLIDRYGGYGLALAALTPLPYSLACWAAGTSPLSYGRFIAISAPLRALRVIGVLWLVQVGLWAMDR